MKKPAKKIEEKLPEPEFKDPVLILRTCNKDLKSYKGFQWPKEGPVSAPDFNPSPECGHGLHGLLEGQGDWGLLDWSVSAKALIVETDRSQLIELGGKVKFQSGIVKRVATIAALLCEFLCNAAKIKKEVSDLQKATSSTAAVDENSHSSSDPSSQLAASGDSSQLAASGYSSKLAASGRSSLVIGASHGCVARAADGGTLVLTRWVDKEKRWRVSVAYIGENGIKADTDYKLNDAGEFEEVV